MEDTDRESYDSWDYEKNGPWINELERRVLEDVGVDRLMGLGECALILKGVANCGLYGVSGVNPEKLVESAQSGKNPWPDNIPDLNSGEAPIRIIGCEIFWSKKLESYVVISKNAYDR